MWKASPAVQCGAVGSDLVSRIIWSPIAINSAGSSLSAASDCPCLTITRDSVPDTRRRRAILFPLSRRAATLLQSTSKGGREWKRECLEESELRRQSSTNTNPAWSNPFSKRWAMWCHKSGIFLAGAHRLLSTVQSSKGFSGRISRKNAVIIHH